MAENFNDELLTEVKGIVTKQRELAEKQGTESAAYKTYMENADKKMAEFDKKNEAIVASLAAEKKAHEEALERVKHLEMIASSKGSAADTKENIKKFAHEQTRAWMRKNWKGLSSGSPEVVENYFSAIKGLVDNFIDLPGEAKQLEGLIREVKATPDIIRTDISEFGGFLTPPEWSNELLKQIIEATPIRKYARVKQIGGKSLMQPIRQGVPKATWAGETQTAAASISNYTNLEITPFRLDNVVPVTWDMLNDNKYNISEEIMTDNAIAFAQAEGLAAVKGNGVRQSLGFAADPNVPIVTTAAASLTFDDIKKLYGQMKMGYKPMFAFNRRTLSYLRTLKDSANRYLWTGPYGAVGDGPAAVIDGYEYSAEFIDMDDYNTATGIPIIFADFAKFYQITDRTDMIMIRDEYTRKKEAIVEFMLMRWTMGMPVMKEAGILLKLHA